MTLLLSLLLLLVFPTARADFGKKQLRGLYQFREGADTCPEFIRFQDDELQLEADEILIDENMCTGGSIRFRVSPSEGHAFASHFSEQPVSNAVGSFLAGPLNADLICDELKFLTGSFFTIIQPRQDYLITWFRVLGTGSPLESATSITFTFKRDVAYILVDQTCLYTLGELPPSEETSRACFPADASVRLQSGRDVRMDAVQSGDVVQVGPGQFSEIFSWTHRKDVMSEYVKIELSNGGTISLSAGHFAYVNGVVVQAGSVVVGDVMKDGSGEDVYVRRVRSGVEKGLYNPQTLDGDIVVNDVLVTTYTSAVPILTAHALLAPVRAAFRMAAVLLPDVLFSNVEVCLFYYCV